ncbi:MAG: PQQ-binding-like beta-propeller repeat protein [Phycisphaerae bacterium]|nr:PQQ-binding-like beta-propeller repeat protein [Phycisphaerae bacterium]
MKSTCLVRLSMFIVMAAVTLGCVAAAADWPHWRGPDYDGISKETGFDAAALGDGTKPVWEAEIGMGFSSVTVSEGRAYVTGNVGKTKDVVFCFDAVTGKELWTHSYPEPLDPKYYEGGTSATPTVHDGKVYTISKQGKIFCLNAATGGVVWEKTVSPKPPTWGFAGSGVIQGDLVIFNVGSAGLALNKNDGSVVWENGDGPSGYASAVPFVRDGKNCIALFGQKHVFGLEAATGKELWRSPWQTQHDVNASDPIILGDYVFITSGYNRGCGLIKLEGNTPKQLWENKKMRSQLSGPVLIDGYLYGIDENQLACMDFMTGEVKWTERGIGKGSLMAADGKLIVLSDKGMLYFAEPSPEGFKPISSAQILKGKCWTMPVLANGRIYARSGPGHLVCIDVRKNAAMASLPTSSPPPAEAYWPQFRGPNQDGRSSETGLLKKWPAGGPKLMWTVEGLGSGYSTVVVADGTIYTTGMDRSGGTLFAYDMNGKPKWKKAYGTEWRRSMPGVRGTPTIDGKNLYLISGVGQVFCFDAANGDQKWSVDAFEKFDGKYGTWGIAESPLIDGDNVICTPGGSKATVAALNKKTGETVWTCLVEGERSSYCTPILVERGPNRLIVTMTDNYILGIDARTGKLLWKDSLEAQFGHNKQINPVSPLYHDGAIYATSGYDDGGAMLVLSADGTSVTRKWVDATLDCHHGGVVLVDGHIYGANWKDNGDGSWCCLEWDTGKVMYETHWNCKGSITYADGMLYCYEEKSGNVALVKVTPKGFDVVSSFEVKQGDGKHWAYPVVCGGRLYIRHGDALMAYDIAG